MTGKPGGVALTPLAIAVLALLEERPMHPYEMYQLLMTRHEDELVKIKPGSLYHTVARLAEQELVMAEGTDRAGNRPERTTYRINPAGRDNLRDRITEILRTPAKEYPIFPVALAETHNLPVDDVIALLRERVTWVDGRVAEFEALQDWVGAKQVPRRYWMVIEYLHAMNVTEAGWLRRLIDDLESGALPWSDFDTESGERIRTPDDDDRLGADWGAGLSKADLAAVRKGAVP
ncbi:PadR family transcriptional regulator [Nocardia sp. SYP-A9097]|uniref:PadR family transcriptional regulator n=1 Tax=Nocardia sp. SYP-A9097 TaxID=2663237 RepID=UPI0018915C53|nr:PadR family transcriptional regulator [Nocardia sp. SYP-A9097]